MRHLSLLLACSILIPLAAFCGNVEDAKKELEKAQDWKAKGESKEALAAYNKAIELNPRYAEAYYERGRLFANSFHEWDKAYEDYNNCLKYDHDHIGALKARADHYFGHKKYDQALDDYLKALKENNSDHYVQTQVGRIYMEQGDNRKAMKHFEEALRAWNSAYDPHYYMGLVWLKERDDNRALEEFSKAIGANSKYGLAYNERGKLYLKNNDLDKALKDFAQAIAYLKDYTGEPFYWRGKAYLMSNEYEKAIRDFTSALGNKNKYETAQLYFERAIANCYLGKFEEALPDAKKAAEMDQTNMDYRRLLFNIDARLKQLQKKNQSEENR